MFNAPSIEWWCAAISKHTSTGLKGLLVREGSPVLSELCSLETWEETRDVGMWLLAIGSTVGVEARLFLEDFLTLSIKSPY
jgi:hypothetical protein